jgi:hypothetical protein
MPSRRAGAGKPALRSLAATGAPLSAVIMAMEFGWWVRDPEEGKYQVLAVFHGGEVVWTRKQGHHQPWEELTPITTELWDRLIDEAAKRVPRRLMSPKQFDELKLVRARAEDTNTPKPLKRGAHLKRAR